MDPPVAVHVGGYELVAIVASAVEAHQQNYALLVVARPLVEDEITQPVKDLHAIDLLHCLDDVGVVAHHEISACLDGLLGQPALRPVRCRRILRPPVRHGDNDIGDLAGSGNGAAQVVLIEDGNARTFAGGKCHWLDLPQGDDAKAHTVKGHHQRAHGRRGRRGPDGWTRAPSSRASCQLESLSKSRMMMLSSTSFPL